MKEKLAIVLLGHQESGKSMTWINLFQSNVKTGKYIRDLKLNNEEYVNVFLKNGSFEEREEEIEDMSFLEEIGILLISVQYIEHGIKTIDYLIEKNFGIIIQWLNPGYKDSDVRYFDYLGLIDRFISKGVTIQIRNGKEDPSERVNEIKGFIYGWAKQNDLILRYS
ncbi:hypothetical protein LEP1GSC058_0849 [Leptospira fainei serovar Hurstbridge str. BUT 6]|uniref:Uncharacterized protein n=1 Tax=Leptospira fainei serovar Hurstbridge str. BUT 6 TaxID=1193011 RepID=S3UW19_9LEPT|nr:hypothetical protein [Leptospira fainei]EPG72514.1 hypothetical protein LEP1GSC058_0849 [Leptospira fainei serovar Hurstbridge str. BUT 6]